MCFIYYNSTWISMSLLGNEAFFARKKFDFERMYVEHTPKEKPLKPFSGIRYKMKFLLCIKFFIIYESLFSSLIEAGNIRCK